MRDALLILLWVLALYAVACVVIGLLLAIDLRNLNCLCN